MNINKVIRIEIEKFKKESDDHTEKLVDVFCEKITNRFDPKFEELEEKVNNAYLETEFNKDASTEISTLLYELSNELGNYKNFAHSILEELKEHLAEHSDNIDNFISRLVQKGIFDINRLRLEYRKVNYYKIQRTTEMFNVVSIPLYNSYANRFNNNLQLMRDLMECYLGNIDDEEQEIEDVQEGVGKVKITNVHEMIEHVKDCGYNEIRQTGSHKVFKNENGNVVVVPYHTSKDFNRGLAYTIQKQIKLGSVSAR